ncbi:MAG: radical SAM protein [Armatimonadetes bacterium]|nr:radical SAM protein [Armatimonadota bacterium]
MPFRWSINPYRGCAMGCVYCFARITHWYLDEDGVRDWTRRIYVKVNAPEVLRRELARPAWKRELVALGTATDPYQPLEGRYRITRGVLQALGEFRTPVSIVTKGSMIVRDLDVLQELARGPGCSVSFSVTTMDAALARQIEPDPPPPLQRLRAMQRLVDAGVPAGVLVAPILPGLTDAEESLEAVVRAATDHGARFLGGMLLHLGDVTRDAYFEFLEHKYPALIPEYQAVYRGKYAARDRQRRVQEVVAALKRRYLIPQGTGVRTERRNPSAEQLSLLAP